MSSHPPLAKAPTPESGSTTPGWLKKNSLVYYNNGGTLNERGHCSYKQAALPGNYGRHSPQDYRHGRLVSPDHEGPAQGGTSPRLRRVGCAGALGEPSFDDWMKEGRGSCSDDHLRKISEASVSSVDSQESQIGEPIATE